MTLAPGDRVRTPAVPGVVGAGVGTFLRHTPHYDYHMNAVTCHVQLNYESSPRVYLVHTLTPIDAPVADFDDEPTDPDIDMPAKVERAHADAYAQHACSPRQLERNRAMQQWWEWK